MVYGIIQQSQSPFIGENSKKLKVVLPSLGVPSESLRLDAKTLSMTDGATVPTWPSASGSGGISGIDRFPVFQREPSGAPLVRFTASNSEFQYTTFDRSTPHTVLVVGRWRSAPVGAVRSMIGHAASGTSVLMGQTPEGTLRVYAGVSLDLAGQIVGTDYHVFLAVFAGSNSVVRMDDHEAVGDAGSNVNNNFSFARSAANFADVDVKSAAVWPRALTKTERDAAVKTARATYGI